MLMLFFTWLLTCLGYLGLASYLLNDYARSKQPSSRLVTAVAVMVILAQGYLLHHWIDVINLQNLSVLNVLSSAIWLSLLLITLVNVWQPVAGLLLVVAPVGFIVTLLGWFDKTLLLVDTQTNDILFWHVVLAIFSIAALAAASLQAIFMYIHHQILKGKQHMRWLSFFPSMEAQGRLLLMFISLSLVLLTLMLGNGGMLLWFEPTAFNYLMPKLIMTLLTWILLAFLLLMGWLKPWQSLRLVPGILLGFVIILFAYAGWWTIAHT